MRIAIHKITLLTLLFTVFNIGALNAQESVSSLLSKAQKAKSEFEFTQAIESYKKVLELESSNIWALDGLIEMYLYRYEIYDSAAIYLETRVNTMPLDTNYLVYMDYANCLRMQEKPVEAIKYYNFFKEKGLNIKRYARIVSLEEIDKHLSACRYSIKNKSNNTAAGDYTVTNMDFFVNSVDPEYTPVYIEDENLLLFNARYKDFANEEVTRDDKYFENIYYYDIEESVASSYNPDIDQESHHAVVGKRFDSDSVLIFHNNRLYVTTLNQNRLKKGDPLPDALSQFYFQPHGIFVDKGKTFIFSAMASKERKGGNLDLYISHKKGNDWTKPKPISVLINSEQNEDSPYLSRDGKTLYFSSKGHGSSGGYDFYKSELVNGEWTYPVNLGYPMNSAGDDIYLTFTKDEKSGFFSSNRTGGFGAMDIYTFKVNNITLSGKVVDQEGKKLVDANLTLVNITSGEEINYTTDNTGEYSFELEADQHYILKGVKTDYFDRTYELNPSNDEKEISLNVLLEKDPGISLAFLVRENQTNQPISSVKMVYTNNMTGQTETYMTDKDGLFFQPQADKKIGDRGSYNVTLSKEGYLGKTITYNVLFDKEGVYNVHDTLDLSLEKIQVGQDLSKIIEIKPIYFDVNKAVITPEAAIELDKIVKIMNDNPTMVIELGSHTDSRGRASANETLSERRAIASAEYIKSRISHPERIEGKGYGESRLVNECADGVKCTKEQHQENRRTEFILIEL
jgi:outer membrane protein OmpA-like peptidoglycan-associated protein/tetratricopeptide (TPR) repeat protein